MNEFFRSHRVRVVRRTQVTTVYASLSYFESLSVERRVIEVLRGCASVNAPKTLETQIRLRISGEEQGDGADSRRGDSL